MYGESEKLMEHLLAKLHPSNLVNAIFYKNVPCILLKVGTYKSGKIQSLKKWYYEQTFTPWFFRCIT